MPLKHTTETLLLFILAAATVLTGIIIPTLAALPTGIVPWALVFVVAAAYPLALSRMFRRNRADYMFRLLHWVPAVMLLLWLALQAAAMVLPVVQSVLDWYVWGWTMPAVATGFFLLVYFCLKVLRRWVPRIILLTAAFVPFMIGAVASEYYDWNREIASVLWQGEWWKLQTTGGGLIAQVSDSSSSTASSDKNLGASMDPVEEAYRERLRAIESRSDRVAARLEERRRDQEMLQAEIEQLEESRGNQASSAASVESSVTFSQASSRPATLPNSGFGWSAILLALAGAYCAALHGRTRDRVAALA